MISTKDSQWKTAISILLPKEVILGDAAGSSVSLNFGTPAESVHITASLALSGKGCSHHGGSVVALYLRRAVRCYQIFVFSRGEDCRNSSQNGDNFLAQRRVYEWLESLRNSRISVVDEQRPCRHRTASAEGYAERAEELIRANRRVSVDETADTLAISTVLCIQFFTRTCNSGNFARDGC
jgi:hypothetical protein